MLIRPSLSAVASCSVSDPLRDSLPRFISFLEVLSTPVPRCEAFHGHKWTMTVSGRVISEVLVCHVRDSGHSATIEQRESDSAQHCHFHS
jgi:hypothetical protein